MFLTSPNLAGIVFLGICRSFKVLSWVLALSLHRRPVFGAVSLGSALAQLHSQRRHTLPFLFSLALLLYASRVESYSWVFTYMSLFSPSSSLLGQGFNRCLLFPWSFTMHPHLARNKSWSHLYSISCGSKTHSLGILPVSQEVVILCHSLLGQLQYFLVSDQPELRTHFCPFF